MNYTNKFNLNELANLHISDKGDTHGHRHNFAQIYETYFHPLKEKSINILEIGVCDGASLKMWYDYFPNVNIIGLDILPKNEYENDRIKIGILDQSKRTHLDEFINYCKENNFTFDIIIDDGSHHMDDQQITLSYMFNVLNSKGIYILEDLHTSLAKNGTPLYYKPVEIYPNRENSTLFYLQNYKNIDSVYLNQEENAHLRKNIEKINIYDNPNPSVGEIWGNRSITSIIIKK
jgi:hypothetical protein